MNFIKLYEDLINSLYTKFLLDFISITGHYIWPRLQYKFSSEIGTNTIWCMSCNNKTPRRNMKYWVLSHYPMLSYVQSYPMFINFTNMNIFSIVSGQYLWEALDILFEVCKIFFSSKQENSFQELFLSVSYH